MEPCHSTYPFPSFLGKCLRKHLLIILFQRYGILNCYWMLELPGIVHLLTAIFDLENRNFDHFHYLV